MASIRSIALIILFSFLTLSGLWAQDSSQTKLQTSHSDKHFSFGMGLGLHYGGLGMKAAYGGFGESLEGLNVFLGVGYYINDPGINIGVQNFFPGKGFSQFYLSMMYGTNATIVVDGASNYNENYYGLSLGAGLRLNSKKLPGSYWDFGLIIPSRSADYKDDVRRLNNDPLISDVTPPFPVLVNIGYNFTF